MKDKDFSAMIETLAPDVAEVFCVRPDNPRALPAAALAEAWQAAGASARGFDTVSAAMAAALSAAHAQRLPLFILGSLYLYREARDAFEAIDKK
jgi:dihydrofolate synthase/folylpolyglutamate synthase